MALRDNLVAWYEFNETSGTRADAHGSNDLTDNNSVLSGTGVQGNAADFERSNSEYLSTTTPFTTATEFFSVSFWYKPESITNNCTLLQLGRQTNFCWIYVANTSGTLAFVEDNISVYNSTATLSTGTWYHIVVIKDGNSGTNLSFYVNGAAAGTASVGTVSTPATAAYVGAYTTNGSTILNYADGLIDELGIWDRALSASEVSDLYNSGSGLSYADTEGGGGGATYNALAMGNF